MIKRSTWVMVVLLAILAGLAYYLQQPDNLIKKTLESRNTPTVEPLEALISPADGQINSISIQKIGGQSVALERINSGWTLTIGDEKPGPADQNAVEQIASQVQYLRPTGKINSTTPDLSAFGLDKPTYLFKLSLSSGKILSFKIGNATLAADGYYAQKDDGTIIILEKYGLEPVLNLLEQPPYMFTPTPPATGTPSPTPTLSITATAGSTPITDLTPTKQP